MTFGGRANRCSADLLRHSFGAKLILELKVQQEHIHDKLPPHLQSLVKMIAVFFSFKFVLFLCHDLIFSAMCRPPLLPPPHFFKLSSPSPCDSEAQMQAIIKSAPHCQSTFPEPEHSSLLR